MKTIKTDLIRITGLCLYLVGWNYIREFFKNSDQRTWINIIGVGIIYLIVLIEINLREHQKFGLSKPDYKSMFYKTWFLMSAVVLYLLLKN